MNLISREATQFFCPNSHSANFANIFSIRQIYFFVENFISYKGSLPRSILFVEGSTLFQWIYHATGISMTQSSFALEYRHVTRASLVKRERQKNPSPGNSEGGIGYQNRYSQKINP